METLVHLIFKMDCATNVLETVIMIHNVQMDWCAFSVMVLLQFLDVLEVVGLDRPVRSRAGGDALFDDLGNATSRRDGHHLPPMRKERLSLTSSAARR